MRVARESSRWSSAFRLVAQAKACTPTRNTQRTVPTNRHSSHRRGFNLAELLFVVSAISALSVLAMTVIGLLITAEQHSAEGLWIDVTVSNFAADLTQDAHRAQDMEMTADEHGRAASVTFIAPDETRVTWDCTPEGVVRSRQAGDKAEARETYRLALGSSWFTPPGDDGLLKWTHERDIPSIGAFSQPTPEEAAPKRTFHVQAAVGLHAGLSQEVTP